MNVILSPHFDDAVLSLGGLLAREAANSLVATFFAGTPQPAVVREWDVRCGFADSTHALRERTIEDRKCLAFLGIAPDRIRTFPYLDAEYRFPDTQRERPAREPELESEIQKGIEALAAEFSSTPLKIFIPGFEFHVDHRRVKDAARAAMSALGSRTDIEFFFYQDLPYAMSVMKSRPWPAGWNFFAGLNWKNLDYSVIENSVTRGEFNVSPQVIALTKEDMLKKISGLRSYASQVNHMGLLLLRKLKWFAAAQAAISCPGKPYCEVVYRFEGESADVGSRMAKVHARTHRRRVGLPTGSV